MEDRIKISVGEFTFDTRVCGNTSDSLVLFLHGFPETSHMWSGLMEDISNLGYFSVAPNLRGYSSGACPKGKRHYRLDRLVDDILGIADYFERDHFHLVGHDWGAVIGWKLVHDHPNRTLSWTALSVPHIQGFGEAMQQDPGQRRMSAYVRAFQWPILPERRIAKADFKAFRRLWKNSSPEQVEDYLGVFRNKPQLTAALNYYRANYALLKRASQTQILGDITTPTLFIYGKKDQAIGPVSVEIGHQYIKGPYTFLVLDTGHWLIQTEYGAIRQALEKHLRSVD